ncbi:MAG TPA: protein arginine kinase [Clostridiales bacterium]|nr:protein arginine kinase [Clostridiales bacterium]
MTWYIDQGPDSDVIISSRIRLARDLDHYPFPHRMDSQQARQAADEITEAFFNKDKERKRSYLLLELETLSEEDQQALAEKRLISSDLASKGVGRRVIISRDESVSIMINEEDHIRIQSMQAGLNLEAAYEAAAAAVLILEGKLSLAYSERYGFLTACPTNTGTGMRASVMAHLPGLTMSGRIKDVIESLNKMGFAVRGNYGEHSKAQGHLFQISNQLTLGLTEDDLISDLKRMLLQLIEQERKLRREIYRQQPLLIEDKVMRAYGVLTQARIMTSEEAVTLLSGIRLGLSLGLLPQVQEADLNRIQAAIGPASIQKAQGRLMAPEERDTARAAIIRDILNKT